MEYVKIILFSIAAACFYGILHDQVTARLCIEYFTIGHPPVFQTYNPTLLALGWGIIATWWVGFGLGSPMALCARAGTGPKLGWQKLIKPVAILLMVMACVSLLAGLSGYIAAENDWIWLLEPLASRIPDDKQSLFLADLWAHSAAYGIGGVGGLILCVLTYKKRKEL